MMQMKSSTEAASPVVAAVMPTGPSQEKIEGMEEELKAIRKEMEELVPKVNDSSSLLARV